MAHEQQDFVDGWRTYSSWIDSIRDSSDLLQKCEQNKSLKSELESCQSNLSRFETVWRNNELRNEINRCYLNDKAQCREKSDGRISKSSEESARMRQLGNTSFKESDYMNALNQYTQAIKFAPYPSPDKEDNSLAYALANRSAVLYGLTRYRLCLLDIDLAIKFGYPKESMFKLLIRKVKCLHILSVWANDVEQIKEDLKEMLKHPETSKLVKSEIQNMFEFLENAQPEDMEKDELDVIDETVMKISNVSKTVSQAADCVELSHEKDKGRYLMINKDVTFGRLLVAEEPFVCNLAPSKRDNYCYNCFGSLHSCGLGCKTCSQVLYCSEDCLNIGQKVHRNECNDFLEFQEKLGVAYLVSHIMFKIDFELKSFPVYTKKTFENKTLNEILSINPTDWPDLVYKNTYASVLSLMDHASDYDYDEMLGFIITSVYLMHAFIDHFSKTHICLTQEEFQPILGSVILKHLLQLQTNLISILDQNLQSLVSVGHNLSDLQEQPIGIGLYPTVALLNHSCSPNIISIFHKNKFVARASKALECGTELNYCYGPSVSRMSKSDRQKRLKEQYFFTCNCESCRDNKESEGRALLCPECEGPVIYNQDYSNHCLKCLKENILDTKDYLARLSNLKAVLDSISTEDSDDPEREIGELKNIEDDLSRIAFWRHPLFVQIKSKLIEMATDLDDLDLTLKFCEDELKLCEKTYGQDSYEAIMTWLKLINTKWQKLYFTCEESELESVRNECMDRLKTLLTTINIVRGKLKEILASTNIIGAESSYENELKFLNDIQNSINSYLDDQEAADDIAIQEIQ